MSTKSTFRIEVLYDGLWIIIPGFERMSLSDAEAIMAWEKAKYVQDVPPRYRLVDEEETILPEEFGPRKLAVR